MGRLCERPGCSENAAVAYGMRTQDLVFWLDVLRESTSTSTAGGVLCQRHGDSMVVPLGWTLDDLRDPELHLFRPPLPTDRVGRRTRRRAGSHAVDNPEQLALGGLVAEEHDAAEAPTTVPAAGASTSVAEVAPEGASDEGLPAVNGAAGLDPDDRWTPDFDDGDDLDGLLSARSPLLSRAFRGTDRPD